MKESNVINNNIDDITKDRYSVDMTKGNEYKHIIRFTLPLLGGNILQQLYNIVDTMVVGKYLGKNAIAAIGATSSITYLFYTLCLGLGTGTGIMVSQHYGAKKQDMVKTTIINSAYVIGLFGIVISLIACLCSRNILILLDTPSNLIGQASGYMMITCGGTIAIAMYNWINATLRALGDSKTPLIFLAIASVINVILDLVFVLVFKWGVSGTAWATVIAQGLSAVMSLIFASVHNPYFKFKKEHYRFHKNTMLQCIKMGVPIAAQNALISISMVALQRVTNSFGETVMAAYTVSMRIEQFVQQPFASLNIASSTFTGQNTGAGNKKRAISGYHVSEKISSVFAITIMILFFIFGKYIMGWFVSDQEVIAMGATAMKITSVFYIFLGTIHVTRGYLNGIGDTGYALFNGIVEVVCRVGFSQILTQIPFIGFWGIWITTSITWTATALFSVGRYRKWNKEK